MMNRLLTRRDKDKSGHKRSRSSEPKSGSNGILSLFKPDSSKKASVTSKQDDETAKKVAAVKKKIEDAGLPTTEDAQIEYALQTKYSNGDPGRAFEIVVLFQESVDGQVRPYNPDVYMKGAENRAAVTCYLDSLLFAMFARLGSFEPILYTTFDDEPRRRLATLIRLWVNMLRSGKLIQTDITKHLQEALAACGWDEAAKLEQQDTSEAFGFITGKLELPLLTLEMDIYHEGKLDDKDDHKFVNERLLEVAVPTDSKDGLAIRLEDCLEEHFNTRVEVVRRLERRDTLQRSNTRTSVSGLSIVDEKGANSEHLEHVEHVEDSQHIAIATQEAPETPMEVSDETAPHLVKEDAETESNGEESVQVAVTDTEYLDNPTPLSPAVQDAVCGSPTTLARPPPVPKRATSTFRRRVITVEEPGEASSSSRMGPTRKDSIRKEVLMPAWQFFKIIPWYTSNVPANDTQVADHFKSSRPVLGICLKRYEMNAQGKPVRRNTPIDIPLQIALPHFIQDDKASPSGNEAPLFGNFNLVLQSMVCHRGNSLHSGHYISIIRGGCKERDQMPEPKVGSTEAPPEYAEDRWIKFDDLAGERVSYVDIEKAMVDEMPYLLFYQVQPLFPDDSIPETTGNRPPSYEDSAISLVVKEATPSLTSPPHVSTTPFSFSTTQTSYFDGAPSASENVTKGRVSFSDDVERPRRSLTLSDSERRGSMAFTDASTTSMYTNSTPVTPGDETIPTVGGRLSRAASRFTKGKSRPTSHVDQERAGNMFSDNRISAGFQRLNLMRSKEMLNKTTADLPASQLDVNITVTSVDGTFDSAPPSEKSASDADGSSIAGEPARDGPVAASTWAPASTGGLGAPGNGVDRSRSQKKKEKGKVPTWGADGDDKVTDIDTKDKKHHHHHHHSMGKGKGKAKDKDGKDSEERECMVM